jgi:hypothetical protein
MLLCITIDTPLKSFGCCADEIKAASAPNLARKHGREQLSRARIWIFMIKVSIRKILHSFTVMLDFSENKV